MMRSIQVAAPWSRPSDLATMDGLGGGAHAEVGEHGHRCAIGSLVRRTRAVDIPLTDQIRVEHA
jgi:hypothetical protein